MPTPEMNALSYSPLSKLTELVDAHWDCFEVYLPPQVLWKAKLTEISQIRHRTAHFRVGHADDHGRLLQFLRDLDAGFWRFCTSYNNAHPVLPQQNDPVTARFLSLDPLPYVEVEPKKWARLGFVDKTSPVGMTVEVLRRPWTTLLAEIDGRPGHLYNIVLTAQDGRRFDYQRLLSGSRKAHARVAHLILDSSGATFRITVPAILGSSDIGELLEAFLEAAGQAVGRSRNPVAPAPDAIAAEWPEYVLGPRDPLAFLSPDMKCAFFNA